MKKCRDWKLCLEGKRRRQYFWQIRWNCVETNCEDWKRLSWRKWNFQANSVEYRFENDIEMWNWNRLEIQGIRESSSFLLFSVLFFLVDKRVGWNYKNAVLSIAGAQIYRYTVFSAAMGYKMWKRKLGLHPGGRFYFILTKTEWIQLNRR